MWAGEPGAWVWQQEEDSQSSCAGVQGDDVQGDGVPCGGCGRFAREQRGRAWGTSEAVEEKAAEGTAQMQTDHGPRGGGGAVMARRIGRRSCEAKATARRDELGGATVQPGSTSSLHPCGG
jgi:hypothetical protein